MRVADAFGGADKFKADFKEAALAVNKRAIHV